MGLWQEIKQDVSRYNRKNSGWYNLLWCGLFELGFQVTLSYRIRHRMIRVPVIGRFLQTILGYLTILMSGCYISPRCRIGGGVFLAHPTGVIISGNTHVGCHVDIYQNVTLGQISDEDTKAPTLLDGCKIYAGAAVLGGVTVGRQSMVGANAVVLKDIPDDCVAVGVPARIIQPSGKVSKPVRGRRQ